jgi:NCS1 family nucleobase:cation symporter-1
VVDDLFDANGIYGYRNGWNPVALIALLIAMAPTLPGFLAVAFPSTFGGMPAFLTMLYPYAWFVGAALASVIYYAGMSTRKADDA